MRKSKQQRHSTPGSPVCPSLRCLSPPCGPEADPFWLFLSGGSVFSWQPRQLLRAASAERRGVEREREASGRGVLWYVLHGYAPSLCHPCIPSARTHVRFFFLRGGCAHTQTDMSAKKTAAGPKSGQKRQQPPTPSAAAGGASRTGTPATKKAKHAAATAAASSRPSFGLRNAADDDEDDSEQSSAVGTAGCGAHQNSPSSSLLSQ